jgi:hypothetical protein
MMTTAYIVNTLNDLLDADPEAIRALVDYRAPCSVVLAHHPTVQARREEKGYSISVIGLLNGLITRPMNEFLAFDLDTYRFVALRLDDEKPKG